MMPGTKAQQENRTGNASYRIGFLLIDQFTLVALATAIEPLRMANQLTGEPLYQWRTLTTRPGPVSASDGVQLVPDLVTEEGVSFDMILVVAGNDVADRLSARDVSWLRQRAGQGITLGGICTGAYVLARAGLLDGYDCSAHWECLAALQEDYPGVHTNSRLFTFDRDRLTCTGGDVPIHMMMNLVSDQHGQSLANAISDMFVCERIRNGNEPQRLMMEQQAQANQPRLVEAVQLMQANLEEPLELGNIAQLVGISRRQLERLYVAHLGMSPSRFYLKLRLERGQQLLRQTARPIVEIALMCGFISATHFSRCYRKYMGKPPRAERQSQPGKAGLNAACATANQADAGSAQDSPVTKPRASTPISSAEG